MVELALWVGPAGSGKSICPGLWEHSEAVLRGGRVMFLDVYEDNKKTFHQRAAMARQLNPKNHGRHIPLHSWRASGFPTGNGTGGRMKLSQADDIGMSLVVQC